MQFYQFTVSKEEPEDLTHLAPIAGDECVPLNVPLLDDLLKSFDQANLDYSLNGYMIDVDTDELPLFSLDQFSNISEPCDYDGSKAKEFLSENVSPLFLNSDPHMGRTSDSKTSTPSILPDSPHGEESSSSSCEMTFISYAKEIEDPKPFIPVKSMLSSPKEACIKGSLLEPELSPRCALSSKGHDELSEFTAPYIPTDGSEDFPLLYTAADFIWPTDLNV